MKTYHPLAALLALATVAAVSPPQASGQPEPVAELTLEHAIEIALRNNAGIEVLRHRSAGADARGRQVSAGYLPTLTASMNHARSSGGGEPLFAPVRPGERAEPRPLPGGERGSSAFTYATTTIAQPLTSLLRTRAASRLTAAEARAAGAEVRKGEQEVASAVETLYYAVLAARAERIAATTRLEAAEQVSAVRVHAVSTGTLPRLAATESRAAALAARERVLEADDRLADLTDQLGELMGMHLVPTVELIIPEWSAEPVLPADVYVRDALQESPELAAAEARAIAARAAVAVARVDYIPEVTLFGQHLYQTAVPFVPESSLMLGIRVEWTAFDGGRRASTVRERTALRAEAEADVVRVRRQLAREVEQAVRRLERAERAVALAREVSLLRAETARLRASQVGSGLAFAAEAAEASAAAATADAELLAARVNVRIARADLDRLLGRP